MPITSGLLTTKCPKKLRHQGRILQEKNKKEKQKNNKALPK